MKKTLNWPKIALGFLFLVLLSLIFFGCYTDKKATRQVKKAIDEKPQIAAALTREAFPCINKKSDTTIVTTDTTINIECPDSIYSTPATDYFTVHDTIVRVKIKTVSVPVKIQQVVKYIETFTEDSAKIKTLQYKIDQQGKAIIEKDSKIKDRNKLVLWLLIFLVISGFSNFVLLKRK